ncbi:MAG: hypothetical protein HZB39_11330 [Planctomycetes bacterium]|nr:hypothetical protein [Planctomycetota bacterium]
MTSDRPVRTRHRIAYAAARAGLAVLAALPERIAYTGMAAVARAYLACARGRRRLGLANLELAFPEADGVLDRSERLRIVREGTVSAFLTVLDLVYASRWLARGRLLERVDVTEWETRQPKPPFLGVSLHLGSWEVAALTAAFLEHEVHVIGRLPKNPLIARFLRARREAFGLIVHDRRGGVRPIARALHAGKVVVQAADQNQRLRGVFVPVFGRLASSERAAATLAVRRDLPLFVGCCVRVGKGFRFAMRMLEPFPAARTGVLHDDVVATVKRVTDGIERLVRERPDQYLWIHDRYRTRPGTEPEPGPGSQPVSDD